MLLNIKNVIQQNKDYLRLKTFGSNLTENKNISVLKPFFSMCFLTMIYEVSFIYRKKQEFLVFFSYSKNTKGHFKDIFLNVRKVFSKAKFSSH